MTFKVYKVASLVKVVQLPDRKLANPIRGKHVCLPFGHIRNDREVFPHESNAINSATIQEYVKIHSFPISEDPHTGEYGVSHTGPCLYRSQGEQRRGTPIEEDIF